MVLYKQKVERDDGRQSSDNWKESYSEQGGIKWKRIKDIKNQRKKRLQEIDVFITFEVWDKS